MICWPLWRRYSDDADRKANKPPGAAALVARARLMGPEGAEPVVDLDALAEVVRLAFPGTTDVTGGDVTGGVSA